MSKTKAAFKTKRKGNLLKLQGLYYSKKKEKAFVEDIIPTKQCQIEEYV